MTATEQSILCPSCKASNSVGLEGPIRLCLECRTEWNPADVVPDPAELVDAILGPELTAPRHDGFPPVPTGHEGVDAALREALGDPDGASGPVEPPADWTGFFVRDSLSSDHRVLLVLDDDGGDSILCETSTHDEHRLPRTGLTFLGSDPAGPGELVAPIGEAEPVVLAPIIFAVAGLSLEAGVAAVGADGERELYQPRTGWLPPPCDGVPEVEAGIAYAIAILIRHFDLDNGLVSQLAAGLLIGAEAGTEQETEQ